MKESRAVTEKMDIREIWTKLSDSGEQAGQSLTTDPVANSEEATDRRLTSRHEAGSAAGSSRVDAPSTIEVRTSRGVVVLGQGDVGAAGEAGLDPEGAETAGRLAIQRVRAHLKTVLWGVGVLLTLVASVLIYRSSQTTQTQVEDIELVEGTRIVKHEFIKPSNPIDTIRLPRPLHVRAVQLVDTGQSRHFLLTGERPGVDYIDIAYANGDVRRLRIAVRPRPEPPDQERKSDAEKIQILNEARQVIAHADRYFEDRVKSVENYHFAMTNFRTAQNLLRQIKLYSFIPEYRDVVKKLEILDSEVQRQFLRAYDDFYLLSRRGEFKQAKERLELIRRLIQDEQDDRHLLAATYLEFAYQDQ